MQQWKRSHAEHIEAIEEDLAEGARVDLRTRARDSSGKSTPTISPRSETSTSSAEEGKDVNMVVAAVAS